jgi:ankyrin repeat protein
MTAVCPAARGGDDNNNSNINRSTAAECLQSLSEQDEIRRWARSPTQPSRWQPQQFRRSCEAAAARALTDRDRDRDHDHDHDRREDGADLDSALNEDTAPSRELMDLIVAKSWHRAARLCQSSPRLARYRGPTVVPTAATATAACSGAEPTCLFAACQNRPPVRVVQALLAAHPEAAGIECHLYDSPSGIGEGTSTATNSSNTSNETATPEAASANSICSTDRWLPLHMACRYNASLAVLQTLLTHHPEASLHDGTSATTTTTSLSSISYPVNELYDHRDTFESSFAPTNYRSVFWQKVGALLRAMAECQRSTRGHVAAMSGIPDLLDYALSAVNNSDSTMPPESTPHPLNAQGQTPLHVALLHAATFPASPISTNILTIVTKLLAHDASMANAPDPQGRYPLHYALSLHCHPHVHAVTLKVLQAVPGSVTLEDPVTRLFPFQMAASLSTVAADVVDVEVVYRILRTHPSALGRCRNDHAVRIIGNTSACSESSNSVSDVNDELTMPFELIDPPSKEEVLTELISAVAEPAEPEPSEPEHVEPLELDSPTDGDQDGESEKQQQQHHGDEDDDLDEATVVSQPKVLQGTLEDAWTMKTRSCPSSPAKPQRAATSLSASSHGPKSITLSDFFQSPRTNKKKPITSRRSSTVAMAVDEAMSADTCLLSGTVDFDDEEDVDNHTREAEESVAVREESDPIVRSINGMCSGALLLLTTMFHNSSADALGSSSHHAKKY